MNENNLILFAKEPVPGKVKTRLAGLLSEEGSAKLYEAFLKDIVYMINSLPLIDKTVACWPDDARGKLEEVTTFSDWNWTSQKGNDLGERMYTALSESFDSGYKRTVIVGSDSPTLPHQFISQAFEELSSHQLVLGPSTDGGYYLIGMSELIKDIFVDIPWSTDQVLAETVKCLQSASINTSLLSPWYDVDTPDSLHFLQSHIEALRASGENQASETEKEIRNLLPSKQKLP